MKLNRSLIGAAGLLFVSSQSFAADVYTGQDSLKDEPDYYAPALTWAGYYVGGHLGASLNDQVEVLAEEVVSGSALTGGFEVDGGFIGGFHVGHNWQTPSNWVYGVEADVGFLADEAELSVLDGAEFRNATVGVTEYLASIRGRLGIATGNSLLYTTAGVAFLEYDDEFIEALENQGIFADDSAFGFVVGAGVEHKLTSNFSVGLEGLWYAFADGNIDAEFGEADVKELDRDLWTVRARASYHFNGGFNTGSDDSYKEAAFTAPIAWNGFYAGGHLGASLYDEVEFSAVIEGRALNSGFPVEESLVGGVHVGYNWQTPSNWVYGVEGDLSFLDDEANLEGLRADLTDYLASIRGRLGIATGNSLLYTTAGVAFLQYDDEFIKLLRDFSISADDSSLGVVVGAGVEHKFANNFSVGLEGLYYAFFDDIDSATFDEMDRDLWTVRARASYHFNSSYADPLK